MGVSRAPETEVDDRAAGAATQVFRPARGPPEDPRNEIRPGLGQAPLPQVIKKVGMKERQADLQAPVMPDDEIPLPGAATEQVPAGHGKKPTLFPLGSR